MLHLAFLSSPEQKKQFLEDFISQRSTWVVSDLRNKFEVQNLILQKQDYFEDLSVIRASELWRFLFKRTHPEWKIISNEFLKTWIRDQLKKKPEALSALASSQSDQVIYDMMNLMAPLLGNFSGPQKIREWFGINTESLQRWGGWYLLAEELFDTLIKEKRTSLYWLSSLLQSQDLDWQVYWNRPLIFDLGSQITQVEAEIIKNLSQDHDVLVIAPQFQSDADFKYLLKPYEYLLGYSQKKTTPKESPTKQKSEKALRFSGPLAEAKKSCEQVRIWLDQKIEPSEIAIIAPDIEQYWPLLDPLFEAEGIPVAKDRMVRLQSLPAVAEWISQLKVQSKEFNYSDLEMAAFFQTEPELRFEEFHALFSEMLTHMDLKRHHKIETAFKGQISSQDELSMEEFIGVSLRFWQERSQFGFLEICIRELMAHAEMSIDMNISGWINYLSQIVAKKEVCISRGPSAGVQLTNLSSADSVTLSHRIFLGLTESMVQNHRKTMISSDETHSISSNIGFDLSHPEASTDEFDLEWLSRNSDCQDLYSYPQTGFSGSAEAPCALWLAKGGVEELDVPQEIRWDFLKKDLNSFSQAESKQRIEQDLGAKKLDPLKLIKEFNLSPSSIESYRKCAFIFTSQKLFRLMDFPILDLDVDRRTRGLLAHALLEKLTASPRRFEYSADEIRQMLDQLREPLGLGSMDEFIWQGIKEKHRAIGERFLDFEKTWKTKFPETEIAAVEKSFEFQFKDNWKIRGKIDRIDKDSQGNLVVLDYKVSAGDHKNFNAWLSDNQIQLALYMLAIESNALPEFNSQEVIGAFYYVLKTMNRDKGLKLEEKAGSLFELDRKKNRISIDKKAQLLKDVMVYVAETVEAISQGIIDPVPLDPKDCPTCHWRSVCRAPHLN